MSYELNDFEKKVVVIALDEFREKRRPQSSYVPDMNPDYLIASKIADRLEGEVSRLWHPGIEKSVHER
jgi:hypothetical protein